MKLVQANKFKLISHHFRCKKNIKTQPIAIDLFKEMHCSQKSGFCEPVKNAIVSTVPLFCKTYLKVNLNIWPDRLHFLCCSCCCMLLIIWTIEIWCIESEPFKSELCTQHWLQLLPLLHDWKWLWAVFAIVRNDVARVMIYFLHGYFVTWFSSQVGCI